MEFTTTQLYALFAIAVFVAGMIGITYCAGLHTGRKSSDYRIGKLDKINAALNKTLAQRTQDLLAANRTLEARESSLSKLRQSLREEQCDHDNITNQLLAALARATANGLTLDDHLTLNLAAKQLGIAADKASKSGSSKTNQAALAQSRLNEMATRLHAALTAPTALCVAATHGITDTDLIEWLDRYAAYNADEECGELRFEVNSPLEGFEHARDVLCLAVQQQRAEDYGLTLGATA